MGKKKEKKQKKGPGKGKKKGGLDLQKIEGHWQEYWETQGVHKFDFASGKPLFSIDTPPPTVSGSMHLGHAFCYSQQDVVARYRRMRGFNVFHPFGFDDNGLATERFVEQARGIKVKDFSRDDFIKICLEETKKAEQGLKGSFTRLGMSVDWGLLYRTISDESRKISQTSFIDIWQKGRAYRKEAPTMWCPTCETAIAQAELEDMELDSVFSDVVFKLVGGGGVGKDGGKKQGKTVGKDGGRGDGEDIVIATTRPELLPACVAVFVNPEDKRYKGLVGKKAKVPLFDLTVPIIADRRADPEKGTGVVMCCTFGDQTDIEWYLAHNLHVRMAITTDGRMNALAGKYKGMPLKKARAAIISDLKKAGLLKGQKPIKHVVNVHERCKTDIEFVVSKQWFIKYLDLKDEFIAKAEALNWVPAYMKSRYDNWVRGLQWDWCISRQRYFGIPFPVWYCKQCGEVIVALEAQLPVDPLKDKPRGVCGKCGGKEFEPEQDVLDTWATSSLTPQINAKWGIDDKRFKRLYPMNVRPQGHDIITLWGFNTIVKGLLHHGQLPWNDIMINGWALDPKGKKMSKSLGNVVDPQEMVGEYSADALRYWACGSTLGEDVPFQEKEMVAGRKFIIKLYNASRFIAKQLADAGVSMGSGLKPCAGVSMAQCLELGAVNKNMRPTDRWVLSRINSVKKSSVGWLDNYAFSKVLHAVRNFFWLEFADFYIEEVKHRVYTGDSVGGAGGGAGGAAGNAAASDGGRQAALYCLRAVMLDCLKMLAPFMPHITEEIYMNIFGAPGNKKSIHLEDWPEADEKLIDEYYESLGGKANAIIAACRKEKSERGLALNAPIGNAAVYVEGKEEAKKFAEVLDDIRETMRIRKLDLVAAKPPKDALQAERGVAVKLEF